MPTKKQVEKILNDFINLLNEDDAFIEAVGSMAGEADCAMCDAVETIINQYP